MVVRAQLMLDQGPGPWETGPREPPLGRGVNFEIEAPSVHDLCARLEAEGEPLFRPLETVAYRAGAVEHVQAQFLVHPDGFLLRFVQPVGERPAAGPG